MGAFKGWMNTKKNSLFAKFPSLGFPQNNLAYGFPNFMFWLSPLYGPVEPVDGGVLTEYFSIFNNYLFAQPTLGNKPLYLASVPEFNNLPGINSNSTAKWMRLSPAIGIPIPPKFTFVLVAKNTVKNGSGIVLSLFTSGSGTPEHLNFFPITVKNLTSTIFNTGIGDTLPHIVAWTNQNIIVDGIHQGSYSFTPSYSLGTMGYSGTGNNFIGIYGDIILFPYEMTTQQLIQLSNNINENYLIY